MSHVNILLPASVHGIGLITIKERNCLKCISRYHLKSLMSQNNMNILVNIHEVEVQRSSSSDDLCILGTKCAMNDKRMDGLGSRNSVRLSVRPSVCLSVTRVDCYKTK